VGLRNRWTSASDAVNAARQVGVLFVLSGVLALAALPSQPDRTGVLTGIALSDFAVAVAAVVAPWQRWEPWATAWIAVPGCVILGVSTWAFGGFAAGTGPFFVLLFAWLGLHHTRRVLVALTPLAALAYAAGLVAADADSRLVASTVVLIPIALAVGLIISNRVAQLTSARERIEQQDQWRAALISTLAHDVRSPLTSIVGALEIVTDDPNLPEHLTPFLTSATRQADRIASLAASLLDVERVDQGKLRLDTEQVDLAGLAAYVAEMTGGGGDVVVDIDPELRLTADPLRLEQMLVNLTTNALRHGSPPVVIEAHQARDAVTVTVRDHGDGVPPGDQPHLFERLSPADRHQESVGLGLWIVKMLAEAHHGHVGYRTSGSGAEFTITLPADGHPGRPATA
jgi:signal transduction histidine kinase